MATDRESFLKNLKRCEFGSVLMTYSDPANSLPGAASKFGGAPSLPSDVQWPTWRSPMFKKERPLSFVAQINCREASPYDVENILLKTKKSIPFCIFGEINPEYINNYII